MLRSRRISLLERLTSVMRIRYLALLAALIAATVAGQPVFADKKPDPKPAGTLATVIRETLLFVSADASTEKLATITPGREMVIVERNGKWMRVFANTDVEESHAQDAPIFGQESAPPPISGWTTEKGVIAADTPNGDEVLFGVAANAEELASEAHAPKRAAQDARLLYRRLVEMFPQSPYAAPAAWRSADIRWQLEKEDAFSRPSAHEKENYLRQQLDDDELKKIQKKYPGTKWADLAAYNMLDNKICGDWQGSEKCPEKESQMYIKYADEHPESPKAAEAIYKAAWRQASASDMYAADNEDKKSDEAKTRAKELAGRLQSKYPQTDYAPRAAGLVYKLEQDIPIYGIDRE
jgi:outer membrane protein assembly factor BamD (BamD/ComL family)